MNPHAGGALPRTFSLENKEECMKILLFLCHAIISQSSGNRLALAATD